MGGHQKYSQSTATSTLPSYLQGAYENIIGGAQQTATTPYQAYTGGFTPDQQAAFGNIASMWGKSDPSFLNSSTALSSSMTPTYQDVSAYMNPYIEGVVNPMMDVMQEQNQRQQQGVVGNAIAKGAMGGNRVGVAQGELARQQKLADNQALGQLYQQGYSGAMSAAQADKAAKLQAAGQYAGLGQTQMETGLAQAGAQLGAGTQQQQFDYQQYLNALAFPYQQQSWLASIAGGLAPSAGGTTTESKPQGNIFSQLLGAGLGVASLFRDGGVVPHRANGGRVPIDIDLARDPARIMRPNPFGMGFDYDASPRLNPPNRRGDWLDIFRPEERSDLDEMWSPLNRIEGEYVRDINRASGGVVPHMAMGGMPYSNDNGLWPSYASGFGAMPGANDNGQFGSYIPKVAIGGGGRGMPTISPDQPQDDPLSKFSGVMKEGAGNIKDWLSPKPQMRLGYNLATGGVAHRADGGVVGRYGYAGGGIPMVAPPALFDETFDAVMWPDDIKRKMNAEALKRDPPNIPRAPVASAYTTDTVGALDADAIGLGAGMGSRDDVQVADFDPQATLSDFTVERGVGAPSAPPRVRVADASGAGVVPFTGGDQFTTTPAPGYSENIGDAWGSLTAGNGLNLSPDMRQALLAAGMGMMSSQSPFALAGIGEGGLRGIETWNQRQALERENASQRAANALTGSNIALQAEQAALTGAETERTGQTTDIERWEATRTPYGFVIRDKTRGDDPGRLYKWGEVMPTGEVANPAADAGAQQPLFSTEAPRADRLDTRLMVPEMVGGVAEQTNQALTSAREEMRSAQGSQQIIQEMKHQLATLPENGLMVPGTGFEARTDFAKGYVTLMNGLGVYVDPNLVKEVGAAEDINKITTRLGFDLSKTLGSNEAASIVMTSLGAVPSGANSPEGAERIIAGLEAANRRRIDYQQFLEDWVSKNQSTMGADVAFNAMNPPELYALSSYVPIEAMEYLRSNPGAAEAFNQKYGGGKNVAQFVLGQ
jgi:hypothetical protein